MAKNKVILEDNLGNEVIPVTDTDSVFMMDYSTKLTDKLKNFDSSLDTKANKTTTTSIQTQVNNLVLGAVGNGNNAEVLQARGNFSLLNDRLDFFETGFEKKIEYISPQVVFQNRVFELSNGLFAESTMRISAVFTTKYRTIITCPTDYQLFLISANKKINEEVFDGAAIEAEWTNYIDIKPTGKAFILIVKKINNTNITPADGDNVLIRALNVNFKKENIIQHSNYIALEGYSNVVNIINTFEQGGIDLINKKYIGNTSRLRGLISTKDVDKIITLNGYELCVISSDFNYSFDKNGMSSDISSLSWLTSCVIENIRLNTPNVTSLWVLIRKNDSSYLNIMSLDNIVCMKNKKNNTFQGNNFIINSELINSGNARVKIVVNNFNSINMDNKIIDVTLKTTAKIDKSNLVLYNAIDKIDITSKFSFVKSVSENGKTIINGTMCGQTNLSYIIINSYDKILNGEYNLSIKVDNVDYSYTVLPLETYEIPSKNVVANNVDLINLRDELGAMKYNIGMSILSQRIYNCVNKYVLEHGYQINNVSKTTQEIFNWLLDKDNCKTHGKLHKDGQFIKDGSGNIVELRGVCLMHMPTLVDKLHTYRTLKTLKYYGVNVVRLPAYSNYIISAGIDKYDKSCYGYKNHKEEIKKSMDKVIEWCRELGLYVIVDYHFLDRDGNLADYKADAIDFFNYFSLKYKDCPNVLYEIVNEPFGTDATVYLDFVSTMRNVILSNVVDPIMIVGSLGGGALHGHITLANNGITDVFYSVHNYTGDGQDENLYKELFNSGYPLFISEWGNSKWSGNENGNDAVAIKTLEFFHEKKIPHVVFQLSALEITCSLLKYNDDINYFYKYGGFNYEDLSANGKLFFDAFFKYAFEVTTV